MAAGEQQKTVVLATSMGEIEVEFYPDYAPKAVENFVTLVQNKYYDGTIVHRVISDFMVQMGDPTGTGRGGKSCWGAPFQDECTRKLQHTGAGILSMANAGPNTNGSQFFITLAPTPHLDGKHTIFGRVIKGMSVLKRMGCVPTDKDDRPTEPLGLVKAYTSSSVREARPLR